MRLTESSDADDLALHRIEDPEYFSFRLRGDLVLIQSFEDVIDDGDEFLLADVHPFVGLEHIAAGLFCGTAGSHREKLHRQALQLLYVLALVSSTNMRVL